MAYTLAGDRVDLLQQPGTDRAGEDLTRARGACVAAARIHKSGERGEAAMGANEFDDAVIFGERARRAEVGQARHDLGHQRLLELERRVARLVRHVGVGERWPPITLRVEVDERALGRVQLRVFRGRGLEAPPGLAKLALAGAVGRLAQLTLANDQRRRRRRGDVVVVVEYLRGACGAGLLRVAPAFGLSGEVEPVPLEGAVGDRANQEGGATAQLGGGEGSSAGGAEEDEGHAEVVEPVGQPGAVRFRVNGVLVEGIDKRLSEVVSVPRLAGHVLGLKEARDATNALDVGGIGSRG